jgi:hypothetical protein
MDNNIRIPLNDISDDGIVNVRLEQDFDTMEILSLKLTSSDAYSLQCSNFGVVCGRVITNAGLGVQNCKVSIFVPITDEDKNRSEIVEIYPFETVNDAMPNGVRYNLLPRIRNGKNPSHRAVGNFPDINDFVHHPQYVEVMEKYYKYTATTNESGDYMIFGVPIGMRDIIMDFDVFDTNSFDITANDLVEQTTLNKSIQDLSASLSIEETEVDPYQVPGFIYRGDGNYEVEVKTNLDEMPNIFHEIRQIMISPFWGATETCDIGITRCDFKINFNYTPTAIFFGFLHAPSGGYSIRPDYNFNINDNSLEIVGEDSSLNRITGGIYPLQDIEVVVYRLDDNLTEGSRKRLGIYKSKAYEGVFVILLPLYVDYYVINEFGDLVPTDDKTVGIPTIGYSSFEFYETDDNFNGRRNLWGGYTNNILPGVRIPSSVNGDSNLGGWRGTWDGLFEYDIKNRKRKYYTVKTKHYKHNSQNVLLSGDDIMYFPTYNPNKEDITWNFPLSRDNLVNIDTPEVIGSVLIPRITIQMDGNTNNDFRRPLSILDEPWLSKNLTYNEQVMSFEAYLGIGVQKEGGKNSGPVYSEIFKANDFIAQNGVNIYGEIDTWNFGDNSTDVFVASLYATELAKNVNAKANEYNVHEPYNKAVSIYNTYGVFINSKQGGGKFPLFETSIYDITEELEDLIKNEVYSSYKKNISTVAISKAKASQSKIYVTTPNASVSSLNVTDPNTYKGKFYYFGLWGSANALNNIESNYFIR